MDDRFNRVDFDLIRPCSSSSATTPGSRGGFSSTSAARTSRTADRRRLLGGSAPRTYDDAPEAHPAARRADGGPRVGPADPLRRPARRHLQPRRRRGAVPPRDGGTLCDLVRAASPRRRGHLLPRRLLRPRTRRSSSPEPRRRPDRERPGADPPRRTTESEIDPDRSHVAGASSTILLTRLRARTSPTFPRPRSTSPRSPSPRGARPARCGRAEEHAGRPRCRRAGAAAPRSVHPARADRHPAGRDRPPVTARR